ncbi:MAG: hypothetical protein GY756_09025 [bacterium]|nr:hypothetical protein [bacterium]
MKVLSKKSKLSIVAAIAIFTFLPFTIFAHCNSDKGPVVQASLQALESGDVNTVLIWVPPVCTERAIKSFNAASEKLINASTEEAGKIRINFYTAMVKCHLKGEGMTFTGVKHIKALPPIIQLSDSALKNGKSVDLSKLANIKPLDSVSIKSEADFLSNQVSKTLFKKYNNVLTSYKTYTDMKLKLNTKKYNKKLVKLGRKYEKDYVDYTHYVLNVYILANDKLPIEETYYSNLDKILPTIKS